MGLKRTFRNIHILLADSDMSMARVVMHQLHSMGFTQVRHVRNGSQAMQVIRTRPVDILITEWIMHPVDGLELIQRIRLHPDSPNRLMPIVMLTGRGEQGDVEKARDIGINEFIVKPFTARTLFRRIEQIIDQPRNFVISRNYVGPERRRKVALPPGVKDRRVIVPKAVSASEADKADGIVPTLVLSDNRLRHTLGLSTPLSSIVTEEILQEAQDNLDGMGDESLEWLKEDLHLLESSLAQLWQDGMPEMLEEAKYAALSIKSRAGVFGYSLASEVARLLYLFLSTEYRIGKKMHHVIVQKHVQVLKVIVTRNLKEDGKLGQELIGELKRISAA